MSFRGRDAPDVGNSAKMDLGEPRRFGGGMMDDKGMADDTEDRRFDLGRGRRPPFGRGRIPSPPGRDRPRDYGRDFGRDESSMPIRDRSPLRGADDRFSDRYKKDEGGFKRDDRRKDAGRPFYGEDSSRDRFMEGRSRLDGPGGFNSRFDGPNEPYKQPRSMNYSGAPKTFFNEGFPKPNECEIIAVNKHQRAYAESVEARIKEIGILVDVLFLKDEALLTQTIDDIARRGSLYAMVISPQNETHGSVTVNILHGTPQEHRNMPLDDALKLVARNFHEHVRMQKENMERERAERGPYIGGVSADREIQFLLRMLADGRWISSNEITAVIRYLSERRDKTQGGMGDDRSLGRAPMPSADLKLDAPYKPIPKDDLDVAQKEQDLQNRIINIMNQGAPPSAIGNTQGAGITNLELPAGRPNQPGMNMRPQPGMVPGMKSSPSLSAPQESQRGLDSKSTRAESGEGPIFPTTTTGANASNSSSTTPTYLNFNNPTVQKALDDLMQSGPSLLKNISMSGSNSPQSTIAGNTQKSSAGATGMGQANDSLGMQRSNMGPPRGPGGMPDMPGVGQPRSSLDMGPLRGPGNMGDIGPGSQRGPGNMGDIGPGSQRGPGNMGDIGPGSQRGPGGIGGPGSQRGPGGGDLGGPGSQRSSGGVGDIGGSGSQRGPGGISDIGGPGLQRGPGGMSDIGGPGSQRGPGSVSDIGGPGSQRGSGSDMMGMGPQRGGYGSNISDMGGMNSMRGFGSSSMSDQSMGPPRMSDMGRMGGPPHGMGMGNNFTGQSQFGKYQGGPGQQGNFSGSYNSSNMGNMPRQNYTQGMGGGPRRY